LSSIVPDKLEEEKKMTTKTYKRPFGVTILAILAGVLAGLAAIHTLQALAILPYVLGPFSFRAFSFFNASCGA